MEEPLVVNNNNEALDLPPGFRFHPTDEEIITHYLTNKVLNSSFSATAIGEADLNKCEPWDLPKKAKMGEKDWYFFCQRDRKYPTGMRTNRATQSGYWKATGKDKEIYKKGRNNNNNNQQQLVGMKKTLVFYRGRAPKGEKTNWVMHEFRLEGKFTSYNLPKAAKDEWVVSRVFHKNTTTEVKKTPIIPGFSMRMNSIGHDYDDDLLDFSSLPPLVDPSPYGNNNNNTNYKTNSSNYIIDHDIKDTNCNPPHQLSSSSKSPSQDHYVSSFLINNNNNQQYQIVIKPEDSENLIDNSSSPLLQQNMFSSDYYCMHQMQLGNDSSSTYNVVSSGLDNIKQFSATTNNNNNSVVSVSQDTCLSNDRNTTTDTSSVVSKHDHEIMGRNRTVLYEDLELDGPSSSVLGPLSNFDQCIWDDY